MTTYAPNTGVPFIDSNVLQPSVPFNDAMRALDAVVQLVVQTTTNTPPTTTGSDVGKRWIVGASPTGAWAGQAGKIALCYAATLWKFYTPQTGWFARDITAGAWFEYTGSAWAQRDASTDSAAAGTIVGLGLEWVSATSIRVLSGAAHIEGLGRSLPVTSAITKSSLSLSASTWYHVYLYLNGSAADIEIVTTAPATAYRGTARSKTGDTSRRYLGSVRTDASGNVLNFLMSSGSVVKYRNQQDTANFRLLSGGTSTTETSVSLANALPVTARIADIRLINTSSATALYTGTSDDSAGGPPTSGIVALSAGKDAFTSHPVNASQAMTYWFQSAPSSGAYIDVYGYQFER